MAYDSKKAILIDEILRVASVMTLTVAILVAPNATQLFDKRVQRYFSKMDKRKRANEIKEAIRYIKQQKLITEDYQFGIKLTNKARVRLEKRRMHDITLASKVQWDGRWRILFFDIPEKHKSSRDTFAAHIRRLGFKVLQRSVFVYPYDCREEIELLTSVYHVAKYVSYVEVTYIDNERQLKKMFANILL